MKGTITIPLDTGGTADVEADIFGAWAVHVTPNRWTHGRGAPKPALAVTHVATGLRAGCSALVGVSKREAAYVARRLNESYPTLPDDVLRVARGECELSETSAAFMRKVGEFISETVYGPRGKP